MKITKSKLKSLIRETLLKVFEDADADTDSDADEDTGYPYEDTGDSGEDTGSSRDEILMPVDMNWVSWGKFAILPYDDVMNLEELPLSLEKPGFKLVKYESEDWRIKELYKHCLGKGAGSAHGYGKWGYDMHPVLKRKMLPPGWTLAMAALIVKVEEANLRIEEAQPLSDKMKYVNSQGFSKLEELQEIIDVVMKIDSKYF